MDRRRDRSASGLRTGGLVRHGRRSRAGVQFCAGKLHLGPRGADFRVWALRSLPRRTRCFPRTQIARRAITALIERATRARWCPDHVAFGGHVAHTAARGASGRAVWVAGGEAGVRCLPSAEGRSGSGGIHACAVLLHRLTHISRRGGPPPPTPWGRVVLTHLQVRRPQQTQPRLSRLQSSR